jgi:hypothetical protein
VLITVVKKADGSTKVISTTVGITSTAAYPDLSQPYAINFNRNLVGKNALKVGISSTGLLSSSKATSTSGLTDALKNLAESVGMLSGSGLGALPDPVPACGEGTHTFMYTVEPGPKPDACDQKSTNASADILTRLRLRPTSGRFTLRQHVMLVPTEFDRRSYDQLPLLNRGVSCDSL